MLSKSNLVERACVIALLASLPLSQCFAQSEEKGEEAVNGPNNNAVEASAVFRHDGGHAGPYVSDYLVTFRVVPKTDQKCDYPNNNVKFQIPVTREYFDSVQVDQEITSWFNTYAGMASNRRSHYVLDIERWRLIVVEKSVRKRKAFYSVDK